MAKQDLVVGNLKAAPGTKVSGFLPVPGTDVQLPVTLVNGAKEGPRLSVTGGIHGAEYPGIDAAIRFAGKLDPAALAGTVVVVHISNPPAFHARTVYINPMDGKNLNRVFPGDPNGTASEKIAHTIFTNVMKGSDAYIDLHGGDMIEDLIPFTIVPAVGEESFVAKCRDLANTFGISYVAPSRTVGGNGTTAAASSAGIPCMLAEAGAVGQLDEESVQLHLRGLERVLKMLKMVDAGFRLTTLGEPGKITWLTQFNWTRSEWTGLFYSFIKVGANVKEGQVVGEVRDYFGKTLATVKAPVSGIVLFLVSSPATDPTSPLFAIG